MSKSWRLKVISQRGASHENMFNTLMRLLNATVSALPLQIAKIFSKIFFIEIVYLFKNCADCGILPVQTMKKAKRQKNNDYIDLEPKSR